MAIVLFSVVAAAVAGFAAIVVSSLFIAEDK